jgi:hypothetical protein
LQNNGKEMAVTTKSPSPKGDFFLKAIDKFIHYELPLLLSSGLIIKKTLDLST